MRLNYPKGDIMTLVKTANLIIGIILLILSIPTSSKVLMEKVYDWEMKSRYEISELNEMYKGAKTTYEFADSQINVFHESKSDELVTNEWGDVIKKADVYLSINGEITETLVYYPVKIEERGLNQYTHYISYWLVEEKDTKKRFFVIILQKNPSPYNVATFSIERLEYISYTISETGTITRDTFNYENKNKLQTKLIPPMYFGGAGFYSDIWNTYYPFLYLIITILGFMLILVGIPFKSNARTKQ
ncbi:hypothetical protein [Metabacillus litoralis]|uniref:hypothetical protein n=1 Tax=Metabacillus litoralis TaxID=152268 RepID=UPI00203AB2A3|nr:hypothetical protein [Metabacillus litoralis]